MQNELIKICDDLIRGQTLNEVKYAKFFTLIADETTDVIEVRTGGLARLILEELKTLGLDPNFMVGQAYDGCAAMSGQFNEYHVYIQNLLSTGVGVDSRKLLDLRNEHEKKNSKS
ncbi:unnamed protein product [Rotaria sordida]|uniref:DUF4371 domain-containing protein n=1 Tax=Rotaria sordida TaxID=392033 RepID=A0A816FX41_9BILA|nr:unnamed protein product [Rotaria sordida]CAF1666560.1 unnamed protein product [Rotaria sordida]